MVLLMRAFSNPALVSKVIPATPSLLLIKRFLKGLLLLPVAKVTGVTSCEEILPLSKVLLLVALRVTGAQRLQGVSMVIFSKMLNPDPDLISSPVPALVRAVMFTWRKTLYLEFSVRKIPPDVAGNT